MKKLLVPLLVAIITVTSTTANALPQDSRQDCTGASVLTLGIASIFCDGNHHNSPIKNLKRRKATALWFKRLFRI